MPGCVNIVLADRSYTTSEVGAVAKRNYPMSEVRGGGQEELPYAPSLRPGAASEVRVGGQEDQPHVQGAVAAQVQEGLEELSHVEGQEGWR